MSDTSLRDLFTRRRRKSSATQHPRPGRARRIRRVLLVSGASLVVLVGVLAGAGFLVVNHLLSGMHRIGHIAALTAAHQPAMPSATRGSQTILLTGSVTEPSETRGPGALGSSTAPQKPSGLIALVHLNADGHTGAVVSIPPDVVVRVPGRGRMKLEKTLTIGGPSLLITTVERMTNVRVEHYSVLDFNGVGNIINALGGVNVDVPYPVTSYGRTFHVGENHLIAADALAYVRQPGVSEIGRVLLQQNLVRAILEKAATANLAGDYSLVSAIAGALSVDSNFTNSQITSLALRLSRLSDKTAVFVTAPTVNGSPTSGGDKPVYLNRKISRKLWNAIRHDAVAAFAQQYPFTVTSKDPG
jgi:LCP family protein required for cell wall assembly